MIEEHFCSAYLKQHFDKFRHTSKAQLLWKKYIKASTVINHIQMGEKCVDISARTVFNSSQEKKIKERNPYLYILVSQNFQLHGFSGEQTGQRTE